MKKFTKLQRVRFELRTLVSELEQIPIDSARANQINDRLDKLYKIHDKLKKNECL